MAYMIYQQYTTAIKDAYAGDPTVAEKAQTARAYRAWLQGLEIEPKLRDPLVEQARALEEAFAVLARKQAAGAP